MRTAESFAEWLAVIICVWAFVITPAVGFIALGLEALTEWVGKRRRRKP